MGAKAHGPQGIVVLFELFFRIQTTPQSLLAKLLCPASAGYCDVSRCCVTVDVHVRPSIRYMRSSLPAGLLAREGKKGSFNQAWTWEIMLQGCILSPVLWLGPSSDRSPDLASGCTERNLATCNRRGPPKQSAAFSSCSYHLDEVRSANSHDLPVCSAQTVVTVVCL